MSGNNAAVMTDPVTDMNKARLHTLRAQAKAMCTDLESRTRALTADQYMALLKTAGGDDANIDPSELQGKEGFFITSNLDTHGQRDLAMNRVLGVAQMLNLDESSNCAMDGLVYVGDNIMARQCADITLKALNYANGAIDMDGSLRVSAPSVLFVEGYTNMCRGESILFGDKNICIAGPSYCINHGSNGTSYIVS